MLSLTNGGNGETSKHWHVFFPVAARLLEIHKKKIRFFTQKIATQGLCDDPQT